MSAVDEERASWLRRLDSLRECQVLSHTVRVTEQELAANAERLKGIESTQQQVNREREHCDQREQALQQRLTELRFKLGQALAFTGTTDAHAAQGGQS